MDDILNMALKAAGLQWMPREWSGRGLWIRAIVRTAKSDGTRSWALAAHDGISPTIVKDFGTMAAIRRIEAIYPYRFLKAVPRFADKATMMRYLVHGGKSIGELQQMNDIELRREIVRVAVILAADEQRSRDKAFARLRNHKEWLKRHRRWRRKK